MLAVLVSGSGTVSGGGIDCGATCAVSISTDGGTWTCVVNTDCPRPANVLVCGQTEDQLRDCIACESNVCIRYQPKACK